MFLKPVNLHQLLRVFKYYPNLYHIEFHDRKQNILRKMFARKEITLKNNHPVNIKIPGVFLPRDKVIEFLVTLKLYFII